MRNKDLIGVGNQNILYCLLKIKITKICQFMGNVWTVGENVVDVWEHGLLVFVAALLTIPIKLCHRAIREYIRNLGVI